MAREPVGEDSLSGFWVQHQISVIFFVAVLLLIALGNVASLRRLGEYPLPTEWPRVSVLIPARNEGASIGACVRSLLGQKYADLQVLALDDSSSDETWSVLTELAKEDPRCEALRGKPLPPGWLGKHWACQQLAQAADADLLLFTDADTRHHPETVHDAVAAMMAEEADLLSAFPGHQVGSWGERLLVPILDWSVFSFLPLAIAHKLDAPVLSATFGQFALFRRQAYEAVGGHASVRQHAADDVALGRRIKSFGLRWRLVDGCRRVHCRMYRNFAEVRDGLTKNLFAVFGYHVLPFVFIWLWLGVVFLEPPVVLGLRALGTSQLPLSAGLAQVAVVVSLLVWAIALWRFDFPRYLALFYPVIILLAVVMAMRSMAMTFAGRTTWKGRTLPRSIDGPW